MTELILRGGVDMMSSTWCRSRPRKQYLKQWYRESAKTQKSVRERAAPRISRDTRQLEIDGVPEIGPRPKFLDTDMKSLHTKPFMI